VACANVVVNNLMNVKLHHAALGHQSGVVRMSAMIPDDAKQPVPMMHMEKVRASARVLWKPSRAVSTRSGGGGGRGEGCLL
jgi:hypothetical protein